MNKWLKKELQDLKAYHAPCVDKGIKLDANESPFGIDRDLKEHLAQWLETASIQHYPDTDSIGLKRALAEDYGVSPNEVTCGVGSDQLIDCILRGAVGEGENVMAPYPSFSMYPLVTQLNQGNYIAIPLKKDFSYDVDAFKEAILCYQPRVIFICNPNNPTGSLLTLEAIEALAACAKGLVVVDEAYGEFIDFTALSLIHKYPNLVVLRTFSKAYSLAGARVGYAIGDANIIEMIDTIRPPYNLNSFSQEIAKWVIMHKKDFEPMIQAIKQQREQLRQELIALDYEVYPSAANFLWVKTPQPLSKLLAQEGIYIKAIYFEDQVYYRITVGSEEQNQKLLQVLKGGK